VFTLHGIDDDALWGYRTNARNGTRIRAGFAVPTEAGENPLPGSVGTFYWTGTYGTTFFVDPKQKPIVIMMIQVPLGSPGAEFRHVVRSLAYQALTSN
jgi:CubicO group peptidase (beta-lactamase class C family)